MALCTRISSLMDKSRFEDALSIVFSLRGDARRAVRDNLSVTIPMGSRDGDLRGIAAGALVQSYLELGKIVRRDIEEKLFAIIESSEPGIRRGRRDNRADAGRYPVQGHGMRNLYVRDVRGIGKSSERKERALRCGRQHTRSVPLGSPRHGNEKEQAPHNRARRGDQTSWRNPSVKSSADI